MAGTNHSHWANVTDLSIPGPQREGAETNATHYLEKGATPEELLHGDPSLLQHRDDLLRQVQPDVRDVYGHVLGHLQGLLKPGTKTRKKGQTRSASLLIHSRSHRCSGGPAAAAVDSTHPL